MCTAQTHSLTTWPARRWKLLCFFCTTASSPLTVHVRVEGWWRFLHLLPAQIIQPVIRFQLARSPTTCPARRHRQKWDYIQKDNKHFVFLTLKPDSASKIPKRLRQCNHGAAIWINSWRWKLNCVFTRPPDCLHICLKAPMSGCAITH